MQRGIPVSSTCSRRMAKAFEPLGQLSAPDAKVLDDINRVGWHTLGISPGPGEDGPHWAFSIGLYHTFGHPEVIVLGLPVRTCQEIVNVIGKHVKEGTRYAADNDYAEILTGPFRCAFKRVCRNHYKNHVGYALWFYENEEFPLLQCFWPDKQFRFPWEDGCNEYVRTSQRTLYLA
jgi:hypothetical protein